MKYAVLESTILAAFRLRWPIGFAFMLALHAGIIFIALHRAAPPVASSVRAPAAIMVDLAPEPATPASSVPESVVPLPPPVPVPEPQPSVDPTPPPPKPPPPPQIVIPPTPPAAAPVVELPEPPPSLPRSPPKRPLVQPRAVQQPPRPVSPSKPETAPAQTASPSTPAPAAAESAASYSGAVPMWRGELAERLQRSKRYPESARAHDEQGTATARFTMDRSGHVLSISLVRSSGSQALDEEALALIRRADPLPPMPSDMAGETITLTVPVTFSLR